MEISITQHLFEKSECPVPLAGVDRIVYRALEQMAIAESYDERRTIAEPYAYCLEQMAPLDPSHGSWEHMLQDIRGSLHFGTASLRYAGLLRFMHSPHERDWRLMQPDNEPEPSKLKSNEFDHGLFGHLHEAEPILHVEGFEVWNHSPVLMSAPDYRPQHRLGYVVRLAIDYCGCGCARIVMMSWTPHQFQEAQNPVCA